MKTSYRHMMEQVSMDNETKAAVLESLEAERLKRKNQPVRRLLVAAVLVIGCVAMTAAGWPQRVYQMLSGDTLTVSPDGVDFVANAEAPVSMEDGRLYFVAYDEHIDITDLISEETPYIYTLPSQDGAGGYVAVGGTPENYGWMAFYFVNGKFIASDGENVFVDGEYYLLDGETYLWDELTGEQQKQIQTGSIDFTITMVERPWYTAALERLGIASSAIW